MFSIPWRLFFAIFHSAKISCHTKTKPTEKNRKILSYNVLCIVASSQNLSMSQLGGVLVNQSTFIRWTACNKALKVVLNEKDSTINLKLSEFDKFSFILTLSSNKCCLRGLLLLLKFLYFRAQNQQHYWNRTKKKLGSECELMYWMKVLQFESTSYCSTFIVTTPYLSSLLNQKKDNSYCVEIIDRI